MCGSQMELIGEKDIIMAYQMIIINSSDNNYVCSFSTVKNSLVSRPCEKQAKFFFEADNSGSDPSQLSCKKNRKLRPK